MKFLPIENITFKTKLNQDELIKRLADNIEAEKTFRFNITGKSHEKPYEGRINGNEFNIRRIISYRNSFLPKISGVIEKDFDGLKVKVKMRLNDFVIIFLSFWCLSIGLGLARFITQTLDKSEFNPSILFLLGMLIFAYLLMIGGFKFESNKSKKDLQKIFEAELVKS